MISSNRALAFSGKPTATDEPPAPLAPSDPANVDLLALSDWLKTNAAFVEMQEDVSDSADFRGRRESLLRKFRDAQKRIDDLVTRAWEKEKVRRGIYAVPGDDIGCAVIDTGKRQYPFLNAILTPHAQTGGSARRCIDNHF